MSLSPFVTHFAALPDPRIERAKRHLLLEILVIALCAVLCGAEGWEDIERFGLAKQGWLQEGLGLTLPSGIPSDDTFRRVFARLDPDAFGCCFRAWVDTLRQHTAGEVLAVDGKTLRHSFDQAAAQSPIHMVSVWACHSGLVVGQSKVADKSNEITAVPALLALLDLRGHIITADAMSCQKRIAAQIVAQGGEYVLSLKDNHPHLAEDVALCFARLQATRWPARLLSTRQSVTLAHGRVETRRVTCLPLDDLDAQWQDAQQAWAGLRCFVQVQRTRQQGDKSSQETHYYVSSLAGDARQMARVIRQHWHIENRLHYVLDVAFNEDASRIHADHAPQNFATLRHIALNLLRRDTSKAGIKAKMKRAGWDNAFLLSILLN